MSGIQIEKLTLARRGALGRYFEIMIETLFSISQEIESIHSNVVVRDKKTTIGEFDLLYKKSGQWYHLELAIKFYLGISNQTLGFNWHGPALRDTLSRKYSRMINHQLKLTKYDAANKVLRDLSINSVESAAVMLGWLFYPFKDWISKSLSPPKNISINHATGWWIRASEVNIFNRVRGQHWFPLKKRDWITTVDMRYPPAKTNFKGIKQPEMIAVCLQEKQNRFYEVQRAFIVPDHWGPS